MIDEGTKWDPLQIGDIERIKEILPPIMSEATEIYTDIRSFDPSRSVLSRYLYGTSGESEIQKIVGPRKVKPLRPILNDLRVFKSESEVVNLRKAGQASGRAFTEAMRMDFNTEKDLSTFLQSFFRMQGCDGSAFVPVVAGGRVRIQVSTEWKTMCFSDQRRTRSASTIPGTIAFCGMPSDQQVHVGLLIIFTDAESLSWWMEVVYVSASFFPRVRLIPL